MSDFTLPEGFTTEIRTSPGYDYRDDLTSNRGCNGLTLLWVLRGPDAAIAWELMTGIMHRPINDPGWSTFSKHVPVRSDSPGVDWIGHRSPFPIAGPVALHCPTRLKDWWSGPGRECDLLGTEACYGDWGYSVGDTVLEALLTEGADGVWKRLHDLYTAWMTPDDE